MPKAARRTGAWKSRRSRDPRPMRRKGRRSPPRHRHRRQPRMNKAHRPRTPLTELLDDMARHASGDALPDAWRDAVAWRRAYPELPLLDDIREVWTTVSTRHRLRQSQEQVPENAGPLNSSLLVHRALSLMSEVSPGYLRQFLSYVDALSWLEQIHGGPMPAGKDAPRPAGARKGRSAAR
ncbi:hypothetical protein CAL14_02965 [Bordetella genomosp. 9]|nr:hypothetical protein CAL14_02965 [Bordetella genomosp. 9]